MARRFGRFKPSHRDSEYCECSAKPVFPLSTVLRNETHENKLN